MGARMPRGKRNSSSSSSTDFGLGRWNPFSDLSSWFKGWRWKSNSDDDDYDDDDDGDDDDGDDDNSDTVNGREREYQEKFIILKIKNELNKFYGAIIINDIASVHNVIPFAYDFKKEIVIFYEVGDIKSMMNDGESLSQAIIKSCLRIFYKEDSSSTKSTTTTTTASPPTRIVGGGGKDDDDNDDDDDDDDDDNDNDNDDDDDGETDEMKVEHRMVQIHTDDSFEKKQDIIKRNINNILQSSLKFRPAFEWNDDEDEDDTDIRRISIYPDIIVSMFTDPHPAPPAEKNDDDDDDDDDADNDDDDTNDKNKKGVKSVAAAGGGGGGEGFIDLNTGSTSVGMRRIYFRQNVDPHTNTISFVFSRDRHYLDPIEADEIQSLFDNMPSSSAGGDESTYVSGEAAEAAAGGLIQQPGRKMLSLTDHAVINLHGDGGDDALEGSTDRYNMGPYETISDISYGFLLLNIIWFMNTPPPPSSSSQSVDEKKNEEIIEGEIICMEYLMTLVVECEHRMMKRYNSNNDHGDDQYDDNHHQPTYALMEYIILHSG